MFQGEIDSFSAISKDIVLNGKRDSSSAIAFKLA